MGKTKNYYPPGIKDPAVAGYIVASMGFYRFPPDCDFYNKSSENREKWYAGYDGFFSKKH